MLPLKICLSPSDQLGKSCRANLRWWRSRRAQNVAGPEPDNTSARYLSRTAAYLSVTDVTAWVEQPHGVALFCLLLKTFRSNGIFESSVDGLERGPGGVARPFAGACVCPLRAQVWR